LHTQWGCVVATHDETRKYDRDFLLSLEKRNQSALGSLRSDPHFPLSAARDVQKAGT
jgi:hypothetical protein